MDFCAINCKNHGCFASELVGFSVDSILGFKYDGLIVPTQSVLRIIALNFVKTCLGAPGSGSFRKNVSFFLLAVNTRLLLTSLRACDWSGHVFGASTSPRSLTKKVVIMSPSSNILGGQHVIPNICDIRVAVAACGIRGGQNLG